MSLKVCTFQSVYCLRKVLSLKNVHIFVMFKSLTKVGVLLCRLCILILFNYICKFVYFDTVTYIKNVLPSTDHSSTKQRQVHELSIPFFIILHHLIVV